MPRGFPLPSQHPGGAAAPFNMAARRYFGWPPERLWQWHYRQLSNHGNAGPAATGYDDDEKADQPASKDWFSKIYISRVPPSNPEEFGNR
ncbi:hypothetical protein DL771_003142 [Monosporascus sp. 5C6A]|nr:hypothetical protein DL771_003142 [Monosporascus sp. 5C6A]